jgi:mannose-6-phosphate isomerase-like protein (cupin superfamily)
VGYTVFGSAEREWSAPSGGDTTRGVVRMSGALQSMRANLWSFPPGTRGRRHLERVQEELFVVLEGTATMLLGEPPERVELPAGSIVAVEPGTALQVANAGDVATSVLMIGAPPEPGRAEYLPDVD